MKKVLDLMFVLLCFTGCANKEINYEKPSSIKRRKLCDICRMGRR